MPANIGFSQIASQLRDRDGDAAEKVFRRFAVRLINLARVNLSSRVRQKVDPEDVVQSALNSFFQRQTNGQFELHDWESLWRLLVVITLRKCGRETKRFNAGQRDVRREAYCKPSNGDSRSSWNLVDKNPSPQQVVQLADLVEQSMRDLIETDRNILQLRLQGYTVPEISVQAEITEFTVQAILKRIRRVICRYWEEEELA